MLWWQTATGSWRFPVSRAKLTAFLLAALTIALVVMSALAADDSEEAWEALVKGGHVALIRHGNAPPGYGGDPPGFRFDDCKTQRNLDDKGRAQGKALGEAFRSHGVHVDRIVASPVCRCMDTASLMAVGQVESSWALVPDRDPTASVRLRELKEIVSSWRGPGTLVLVTHGFTIRPLIGLILNQAETAVLRPTPGVEPGFQVVDRIAPPQ
jgi:broad specificity phosphatase PhoE